MRFPRLTEAVIDVTKPPYLADNTGKTDCTEILRRIFDDILSREVEGILASEKRIIGERLDLDEYSIGFENRRWKDGYMVIYPEFVPDARIIYFPAGTYLVSDTVTYTLKDLQNRYWSKPYSELTRGIHIVGEDMNTTMIKLADSSQGFEKGSQKAVVSYTNAAEACEKERSNVSQLNTLENITINCGEGNEGAIALRFVSNNSGMVDNVRLLSNGSHLGLQLPVATEAVFRNVEISGFEYGIFTSPASSVCVFDGITFDKIKTACVHSDKAIANVFKNIRKDETPMFLFEEGIGKQFCFDLDPTVCGDTKGNLIYAFENAENIPAFDYGVSQNDIAFVDDFGAKGDGVTECSGAIQAAMNSGKPYILFGSGHYLVNGKVYIPSTVKTVDFMFCDMFSGGQLISGELDSLFVINEESVDALIMKDLYTFEQFYGNFRLIKHAAKRDFYLRNIHTQASATYFNTVGGSRVYIDNGISTTGTYSMDTILARHGYSPVFSKMIPYEFHGQKVLAYNLNPERADVEVLNDASVLVAYGFKVEGPGTAVKTVNGGVTNIYGFSAGIGNAKAENALIFDDTTSKTTLYGGIAFWGYQCVYEKNEKRYMTEGVDPLHFDIENDRLMRQGE